MPRIAYTAAAFALGVLALTACSSSPAETKIAAENVASAPEGGDSDKPALEFMELSLKITEGCPPLDETKTSDPLGSSGVPDGLKASSGMPTGSPDDRVPLPSDRVDSPTADDPVPSMPDGELLEPVTLTAPEICFADKFAAHVTAALKGVGGNAAELRAALKGAGYFDELIVDMKPEGGSPRVRIDLREQDTRVALQVVHIGASGTVVEKFGAQKDAPLKDVRYIPELAGALGQ
ncbi:hypothetical protein [Streptomyces sp. NPDC055749]